jgi:hypothetical protein
MKDWKDKWPERVTPKGRMRLGLSKEQKTEVWAYRCSSIHNHKYSYTLAKYTTNKEKVKIICPVHGMFEQAPIHHLNGHGCNLCALSDTVEVFETKASLVHNRKYAYHKDYTSSKASVSITCPDHGVFTQIAGMHMTGRGCPTCAGLNPHILYLLRVPSTDVYKIGITKNIKRRVAELSAAIGVPLEVVSSIESTNVRELETELHSLKYINPYSDCSFDGHTEYREIGNIHQVLKEYF